MMSRDVGSTGRSGRAPRPSVRSLIGALLLTSAVIATTAAMAVAAQASSAGPVEAAPGQGTEGGGTGDGPEDGPGTDNPEDGPGTDNLDVDGGTAGCEPGPPPEIGYSVAELPSGEADEPTEPEPCPQESPPTATTAPRPVKVDAANDTIRAFQDQTLDPYDVTENDVILPSLGSIEVLSGTLPAGLTLWLDNSLEGWLIGTPTECGTFAVQYQVTAGSSGLDDGPSDTATIAIEVNCTSAPAPIQAVDDNFAATAGKRLEADVVENDELASAITRIELKSGSLPVGLTLWAGGWLTGTTTETGEFTFTYEAFGTGGSTGIGTVNLAVREATE